MARKPLIAPGSILPVAESPTPPPADDLLSRIVANDRAKRHQAYAEAAQPLPVPVIESKNAINTEAYHSSDAETAQTSLIATKQFEKQENYNATEAEIQNISKLGILDSSNSKINIDSVPETPHSGDIESNQLVQINARVPAYVARAIKIQAIKERQSTQALITDILLRYLQGVGAL